MVYAENITIKVPDLAELELVPRLRHEVLDPAKKQPTELGLSMKDFDLETIHTAAITGGLVVSTVRLEKHILEGQYLIRKMATHHDYRRQGLGARVLTAAEQIAISRGAEEFILDSREEAMSFYAGLGYIATGEEATHNDGIPNFTMVKKVSDG
jgi:predicted GNAT family N-acyltransferase